MSVARSISEPPAPGAASRRDRVRPRSSGPGGRAPRAAALAGAFVALLVIGWGLGELAMSLLQAEDADAVRAVATQRTTGLTGLAHAFSLLGSVYVIAALAVICCAILYRHGRQNGALAVALSTIGAIMIANLDKLLVGRHRPPVHHLEAVSSPSFPSGHATQSTAFFLALLIATLLARPHRSLAMAAAATTGSLVVGVALSRVYLSVHYPTDVAAGVALGGSWVLLTYTITHAGSRGRGQP